jgi:hypothetical protein
MTARYARLVSDKEVPREDLAFAIMFGRYNCYDCGWGFVSEVNVNNPDGTLILLNTTKGYDVLRPFANFLNSALEFRGYEMQKIEYWEKEV